MKNFLPDVNFCIGLAFDAHPHHENAATWFAENADGTIGFCRTTQQGFLRIATNRRAMGQDVVTLPLAWQAYDAFLQVPRISFFEEPIHLEAQWRKFTEPEEFSPNIWTDAYLAAFACSADLRIVTFDRGFARYAELQVVCLNP